LLHASDQLEVNAPTKELLANIVEQRLVRPADNELIAFWYAQYLTIRQELWDIINLCLQEGQSTNENLHELENNEDVAKAPMSDKDVWSYFIIGYSSACLLIRNDRFFLFDIATHSVLQRKFNEASVENRIPRKQYTAIYSAFVDTNDALRVYDAINSAKKHRATLVSLQSDPIVGELATRLPEFESWLDASKRNYVKRLFAYLSHKWRRKGVVMLSNTLSRTVEKIGRAASDFVLPIEKRVTPGTRAMMATMLKPGDVLITRHDTAVTNLFLPGFWPHAALFIGNAEQRAELGVSISSDLASRWRGDKCVFEALKDGVHFRAISETLAVDNFLVLRPNLTLEEIRLGIERVVRHEGKGYNFDFDFFSSDRLVCSEVIYRAFDGMGELTFPLVERAGRHTLSPEDIVNMALNSDAFSVVGIYGVGLSKSQFVDGYSAEKIVASTVNNTE